MDKRHLEYGFVWTLHAIAILATGISWIDTRIYFSWHMYTLIGLLIALTCYTIYDVRRDE